MFGKFDYSVLILSVRCVCTDFVLFYSALLLLVLGKFDYSVLILSVRCVCTDSSLFNSAVFMLQLVIFVLSSLCSANIYLTDLISENYLTIYFKIVFFFSCIPNYKRICFTSVRILLGYSSWK